jgi:hypothetical protein
MGNEFIDKEQLEKLNEAAASEKPKKTRRKKKTADEKISESKTLNQLMNGDFLTKKYVVDHFPFMAFVGFLIVVLIAKGYYVQGLNNNIEKTKIELGEINAQKVTFGSELHLKKRRKNMLDKLEPRGLKESDAPPKKIVIK